MLLSDVCLSDVYDVCLFVAYVGLKSRTERPRKNNRGIANVTCDSDTTFPTFKVKRSKVKVTGPLYSARP